MSKKATAEPKSSYTSAVTFEPDDAQPGGNPLDDPDRRSGSVYVLDPDLKLAIEVALVTGRPLLLRGHPGGGKSSLAAWVARKLDSRFYDFVVTARTRAQDLMYSFDSVRRLADAQARIKGDANLNDFNYVEPGVLWWAFNGGSAVLRGAPVETPELHPKSPAVERNELVNRSRRPGHAVLLIDEIDKADPDVPNNLLVALGSFEFHVEETGTTVTRVPTPPEETLSRLLVIFTTNEERDLPDAFIRRTVVHWLQPPTPTRLEEIAERHFGEKLKGRRTLAKQVALKIDALRREAEALGGRPPSTAEYLDAVRACLRLDVTPDSTYWPDVERAVLRKPGAPPRTEPETGA